MSLPEGFVDLEALSAGFVLDIKYATTDNFMGEILYKEPKAYLREEVALALMEAQKDFLDQGLRIKIWDAYRPFSVQKRMWAHTPDPNFLGQPVEKNNKPLKGSKHNRGAAVDITLVDEKGVELEMPSYFDEFNEKAHREYQGGSALSRENRQLLEETMLCYGFFPLPTEWWHFDGPDWQSFDLIDFEI